MFFEGTAKARKNISLGGNRNPTSSQTLLQQSREEKMRREEDRRRELAVTKIAATFRMHRTFLRQQEIYLTEFDSVLSRPFSKDSAVFLLRVCLVFSPEFQRIDRMEGFMGNSFGELQKTHSVLLLLSFRKVWEKLKVFSNVPSKLLYAWISTLDCSALFRSFPAYYSTMRHRILRSTDLDSLVDFLLFPFVKLDPRDTALSSLLVDFYSKILTIPALLNRIGVTSVQKLSSKLPLEAILLKVASTIESSTLLSRTVTIDGYITPLAIILLSNLSAFSSYRIKQMPSIFVFAYASIIGHVVPHIQVLTTHANTDSTSSDDEMEVSLNNPPYDPKVLYWLRMVASTATINRLVNVLNGATSPQTEIICKALIHLHAKFPECENSLSNALVYTEHGKYLRSIHNYLRETQLYQSGSNRVMPAHMWDAEPFVQQWYVLAFLVENLVRLLYTYGNEEFHSQNNMFGLENLVEFTAVVKHLTFAMYTAQFGNSKTGFLSPNKLSFIHVRSTMTKLLQQIHLRDSYKRIFPKEFWPVQHSFNLASILRDYLRSTRDQPISSPALDVIEHIPFVISFDERVLLFHEFARAAEEDQFNFFTETRTHHKIRRDHVFEDGFDSLNPLGAGLKKRVYITFVSEHGYEESGIDGGGLFKEFLTELCKKAFDADLGLFVETTDHLVYPNPNDYAKSEDNLRYFSFLGRVIGKAILDGILMEVSFARFFLAKWLGKASYLEELPSLDPELYKNLMFLKTYNGDCDDLSLNFTLVISEFGENKVIELIPGGKDIAVTNENKMKYIYSVAYYKLNNQIRIQSNAFLSGLYEIVDPKLIKMFSQRELHLLLSGTDSKIDVNDLRKHTVYSGSYDDEHPTIVLFWEVLSEFTEKDKKQFLKFATSCSRPPLLGFQKLEPKFGIRHPGGDAERLPSASTCFNLLKLPQYPDKDTMNKKLLYAIYSAQGFELS